MRILIALLVTASVALAACGGSSKSSSSGSSGSSSSGSSSSSSGSSSSGGGGTLKLSADPGGQLKFDTTSLSAKAGTVTINMANPSSVPHGVGVKGGGADKVGKVVNKGGTSTVTLKLKPGKYTFFCPVPGHEAAGMKGTLTVS